MNHKICCKSPRLSNGFFQSVKILILGSHVSTYNGLQTSFIVFESELDVRVRFIWFRTFTFNIINHNFKYFIKFETYLEINAHFCRFSLFHFSLI